MKNLHNLSLIIPHYLLYHELDIFYNDKNLYFRIKSYDNTTYTFILTCEYVDTINSQETFVIHTLKVSKENGAYNMTTKYINL